MNQVYIEPTNKVNIINCHLVQQLIVEYENCIPISKINFGLCCSKIMNIDGDVEFSHSCGVIVSSVHGATTDFRMVDKKFTVDKSLQFCRSLDRISLKNVGRLAFYSANDEDQTAEYRSPFRKQDNATVKELFEQFEHNNVNNELDKSFAILETHNTYKFTVGTGATKTEHSFNVPWMFEGSDGERLDDTKLDNLIQRGPCFSPWHTDFMRFGSKIFIPNACQGTVKIWMVDISPSSASQIAKSMFTHLRKLSLSETGTTFDRNNTFIEAVFRYVDHGQLIIILERAGQVVTIPPGVPHAVMTCYSDANPARFCLLLGKNITSNTKSILRCDGGTDLKSLKKELVYLKAVGEFRDEAVYLQVENQLKEKMSQFARGVETKARKRKTWRFSSLNQPIKKKQASAKKKVAEVAEQQIALGKRNRLQTDHFGYSKL
jgi:hypothetical protein